jgi:hypothetical protein
MFRDNAPKTAHTGRTLDQPASVDVKRSRLVAKGQLKGNKEAKKPKQPKKAEPVSGIAGSTPLKVPAGMPPAKKR